jgi:hypothetical protein
MSHHHEFNRFNPYMFFLLRVISAQPAQKRLSKPPLYVGGVIKWARLYESV